MPPYIYFRFLTHTPFFAVFQKNKLASCKDSSASCAGNRRPKRFARIANRTSFSKFLKRPPACPLRLRWHNLPCLAGSCLHVLNSFVLPPRIRVSVCSSAESCSTGNISDYWLLFYEVVLCPCRHRDGGRFPFMGSEYESLMLPMAAGGCLPASCCCQKELLSSAKHRRHAPICNRWQ